MELVLRIEPGYLLVLRGSLMRYEAECGAVIVFISFRTIARAIGRSPRLIIAIAAHSASDLTGGSARSIAFKHSLDITCNMSYKQFYFYSQPDLFVKLKVLLL